MATLHVKMNQTKTIVNALPACFAVRGEDASWQQLCAMEKTIALTEMTKIIAVSRLFVNNVSGLLVKVTFSYSKKIILSWPGRLSHLLGTLRIYDVDGDGDAW